MFWNYWTWFDLTWFPRTPRNLLDLLYRRCFGHLLLPLLDQLLTFIDTHRFSEWHPTFFCCFFFFLFLIFYFKRQTLVLLEVHIVKHNTIAPLFEVSRELNTQSPNIHLIIFVAAKTIHPLFITYVKRTFFSLYSWDWDEKCRQPPQTEQLNPDVQIYN